MMKLETPIGEFTTDSYKFLWETLWLCLLQSFRSLLMITKSSPSINLSKLVQMSIPLFYIKIVCLLIKKPSTR